MGWLLLLWKMFGGEDSPPDVTVIHLHWTSPQHLLHWTVKNEDAWN